MAPKPTANDDEQTETLRDVYGAIDPDDVEGREDWDPALEPEGLVPETAEDGRSFHVAAWDGGVSDLKGLDDMNIYDVREGAPAVVVYLSTHGGVQAFAGELTSGLSGYGRRVEVRDGDDVREVVNVDGQDRFEAVRTDTGRHVGTMLDVRLTRPWGALADYYELPDGVDTLYEVVEVYDDREEVVAVEPTRDAANQARTDHTVAYGEEEPTGLLVRERGADEEDDVEDDDDDDDDEPTFQYDESDMASLPDVDDALEAAIEADGDDDDDRTDGGEGDVEERTTPVDAGVIHDVAQGYALGAGALKGALEGVDTSAELRALKPPLRNAAREALETHGEGDVEEVREDALESVYHSEEFDGLVTVVKVHDPLAESVLDGYVAVDVKTAEGHRETTHFGSLEVPDVEHGDGPAVENPPSWSVVAALADATDADAKTPWVVTFTDADGDEHTVRTKTFRGSTEDERVGVYDAQTGTRWSVRTDDLVRVESQAADVDRGDGPATDGGRPVEDNRRGVAGDPVPDAEYGDGPEDLTPDVDPAEGGHIPPGETPDHIPSPTAPDRDSPVEWTGRAHLVTTSCSECGDSVEVPEGRAEQAARGLEPVTCDDCTHDCLNAAADHLTEAATDPALPPHIVPYSCEACGQRLLFDTETGEHEVDA